MHTLSDHEAEAIGGGLLSLPSINVSPQIMINTITGINAGAALSLFGGMASFEQANDSTVWYGLISGLFSETA
jgi:hypothetical protein